MQDYPMFRPAIPRDVYNNELALKTTRAKTTISDIMQIKAPHLHPWLFFTTSLADTAPWQQACNLLKANPSLIPCANLSHTQNV